MGRFALLVLLLGACPKKETEGQLEPLGSGKEPPSGRSVTKVDDGDEDEDGSGSSGDALRDKLKKNLGKSATGGGGGGGGGETAKAPPENAKGVPADAQLWGGNGAPPYYDDEGHLHGPGGPVYMGKGPECTAERDHCLRDGVWFAVQNLAPGKLYRAVPIFEYEKKWYNWRGKEESFSQRFKTKLASKSSVHVGEPIIWFIDENSSHKFLDNEYDMLTSSRWEAGYVEEVMGDKVRVKGWTYGLVPLDTIRVIVDTK